MVTIPFFGHSQSYFDTRSLEVNANQMNYRNSIYYLLLIGFFLPSLSFASLEPPSNIIASTNQYSYGSWVYWDPVPDAKAYSVYVQVRNQIPAQNDYDWVARTTTDNFFRTEGFTPTATYRFVVRSCEDLDCKIRSEKFASTEGNSTIDNRFKTETPFSYSYSQEVGEIKIEVEKETLDSFQNMTGSKTSDIRIKANLFGKHSMVYLKIDAPPDSCKIDGASCYSLDYNVTYSQKENLKSNGSLFSVEFRLCTMVEVVPLLTPVFDKPSVASFYLKNGVKEPFCVDDPQTIEIERFSDATWESKINAIDKVESSTDQNNTENGSLGENSDEDQSDTLEENVTTDGPIGVNDEESVSQIKETALGTLNWGGNFGSSNWYEIPKTGFYHELIDSALKFKASNVKKYTERHTPSVIAMNFFRGSYEKWENSWGPDIIFGSLNSKTKEVKTNFRGSELIEIYASIKSGDERIGVNSGNIMIFVKASIGSDILYGFNGIINGWEIWNFGENYPWRASRAGGEWPSLIGQLASDERVSVLQGVALPVGTYEFHVLLSSCKDTCSSYMNIDPFVVTVSP